MVDQASVRVGKPATGGSDNGSPEGKLVGGIAEFGNDIATLAELQAKLAVIDLKECVELAVWPLAVIVGGFIFILGALPVALFGAAELVAAALKISHGWALLLTSGVVMGVAGLAMVISVLRLRPNLSQCFRRSREELNRNISWIRTVLLYSGRTPPRRRI